MISMTSNARSAAAAAPVRPLAWAFTAVAGAAAALMLLCAPARAQTAEAPVEVVVVGVFHMSNPGQDQFNVKVDDVLSERRQTEIARVTEGLGRFRPTLVVAEWRAETVTERYAKYQAGTLDASRNEVVQLGFRLATAHGARMIGADVEGEFPFGPVHEYAKAHGQEPMLNAQMAGVQAHVKEQERQLATGGIPAALRYLNQPHINEDTTRFYHTALRIGGGNTQPGVDLLTAWYRRNFLICANIVQATKPGDRVVVFYGSGHAFLLRQCFAETPGFKVVEANNYLPR